MRKGLYFLLTTSIFSQPLFAQTADAPATDQGFWQTLVMLGIFIVFFYFILWRPEQKKKKALEQQRNTLKKGDRVVAMGIIGTVVKLDGQTIILRMYDGSKVQFLKGAITDVLAEENLVDEPTATQEDEEDKK